MSAEKTPREECDHTELQFGSGDFYIFCHACGAVWTPEKGTSAVFGVDHNAGVGSILSGQKRVKGAA